MASPSPVSVGFAVRPRFREGRPLPQRLFDTAVPLQGSLELFVQHYERSRLFPVMELRDVRQGGIAPLLLPALHDPQLITFGARGFLVRGSERIALPRSNSKPAEVQFAEYVQEWHVQFVLSNPEITIQTITVLPDARRAYPSGTAGASS